MSHSNDFLSQDWCLERAAWFRRPDDQFGGFSNMSKSFPLTVFATRVRSTEHLYQAMRFTHEPQIQRLILDARTPMFSKRVSREWDTETRPDWMDIRIDVMRWVLRVKLAQHLRRLGALLELSGKQPIVEWSRHDSFWGAGPVDEATNHGQNVLGRLLTELRDEFLSDRLQMAIVPQPAFSDPRFLGIEVGPLMQNDQPPLVTAEDLRQSGLPPGPGFGPVLSACLQKQWRGEFHDRDGGLKMACAIWHDHNRH